MRIHDYHRLMAMQASRRALLARRRRHRRPRARLGRRARRPDPRRPRAGQPPRRAPEDPRRRRGLPHRCRLAEGRRAVPRRHQGERQGRRVRRRRADLHGPQQPEPAQLPVPRLPEAVGDLHRRQDQLDRPRAGRLQRPPPAVDRHRHGRLRHHRDGRALRGRHLRQGPRLARCPTGSQTQIDMDDYVNYLKAPVGTWDGKTYRISIDGDCHTFAYRTDFFSDADLAEAWKADGNDERLGRAHDLGSRCRRRPSSCKGKTDPTFGTPPTASSTRSRAGAASASTSSRTAPPAYAKDPGRPGVAVRPRHHEAAGQQPRLGPGHPGRPRHPGRPSRADQINADPDTTAFQQFLAGTGSMLTWWGDVGSNARTSDTSVVGDVVGFDINPGADEVYNTKTSAWEARQRPNRRAEHRLHRLGRLRHATRRRRREEAEGGLVRRGPSGRQGPVALDGGLPVRLPALPQLALQLDEWVAAGYDRDVHRELPGSTLDSYNHPNAAIEPRIPGIFQYYSHRRGRARQGPRQGSTSRPRRSRTPSPPAGRRSPTRSAATSRSSSTRPRSAWRLARTSRRRRRRVRREIDSTGVARASARRVAARRPRLLA